MRRSEIDSTRDAGMPSRVFPMAWLVVLVLFSLPLVSACGGGSNGGSSGGSSGGSKWQGAATLIPEDAVEVTVWDIAAIVAGDAPAAIPRDLTDEILGSVLNGPNSIEAVNSFATARIDGDGASGNLSVMEGDFDFNSIREILSEYRAEKQEGSETYDLGSRSIALLEGEGSVVAGDTDAVKAVLDALDRGSGFLLDDDELRRVQYPDYFGVDADEYVGMTLNRAGGGFFTRVQWWAPVGFDGIRVWLGVRMVRVRGQWIRGEVEDLFPLSTGRRRQVERGPCKGPVREGVGRRSETGECRGGWPVRNRHGHSGGLGRLLDE